MEQETKRCPFCGEEILAVAKKCKHCGEWLNKDEKQDEDKVMIPCPVCGEMVEEGISQCPYCHESLVEDAQEPTEETITNSEREKEPRSFFDYYFVEPFVKQYFKFKGRINRKHFWISMLLWFLTTILLISLLAIAQSNKGVSLDIVILCIIIGWEFLSIIPVWAAVLRRMRDGDSELGFWGWWFYILPFPYMIMILATSQYKWLCFIPFIILLWWLVKPSDDLVRDDGLAPDEEQKVAFKKSDKITVCAIVLVVVGLLLASNTSGADNTAKDVQTEERSSIEEQATESKATLDIKEAYLSLLTEYATMAEESGVYGFLCSYFLYDITGDNIPEIWFVYGSGDIDKKLSVYSYHNGLEMIHDGEEGYANSSTFYKGKDYVLQVAARQGYAVWYKITYKGGKLAFESVFEEDINESGQDGYTNPSEVQIEEYPVNYTSPIDDVK